MMRGMMRMPRRRHLIVSLTVVTALAALAAAPGCGKRKGRGQYGHSKLQNIDDEPLPPPPPPRPRVEPPPPPPPPPPPVAKHRDPSSCGERVRGAQLASVQDVDASDVLNIRVGPDWHSAIRGSLPPDATDVSVIGPPRGTKTSTWREVICGKTRGWVRDKFLVIQKNDQSEQNDQNDDARN